MEAILRELADQGWARPIIADIRENGGLTRANKARMFELRFGYALHRAGIVPQYEIPGEGESTIDFGFTSANQPWAVEVMRLEETYAVSDGCKHTGQFIQRFRHSLSCRRSCE